MERVNDELKFIYGKTDYSVGEFYRKFKDHLPQTVMITEGYCGDIGLDEIASNQAVRLRTYSKQRRVAADVLIGCEQFHSKRISIPLDYHLQFYIYQDSKRSRNAYPLRQIIQKYSTPVTVEYSGQEVSRSGRSGPEFRSSRCFRLRLLKVYDDIYLLGNLLTETHLYERTMEIPLYLKTVRLSIIHGISDFSINWSNFLKMVDTRIDSNVKFDLSFGNPDIAIYQDHDVSKEDYCYITPMEYTALSIHGGSEHYYTKMNYPLNKSSRSHAILPKERMQASLPRYDEATERYTKFLAGSAPNLAKQEGRLLGRSNVGRKSPPPLPPRKGSSSILTKPLASVKREDVQNKTDGQNIMYSDNTSQSDLEDERAKLRRPPDKQTRPDESDCSKGGGRLKKSPLPYPANHAAQEKSLVVPKRKSLNDDMQTSLEQAKMKTLTVSEVCEWLDTLKLSKYKASFMENMIDGLLLTELSEDMMRDELGMNRFEALKLKKFAKEGHIPKI